MKTRKKNQPPQDPISETRNRRREIEPPPKKNVNETVAATLGELETLLRFPKGTLVSEVPERQHLDPLPPLPIASLPHLPGTSLPELPLAEQEDPPRTHAEEIHSRTHLRLAKIRSERLQRRDEPEHGRNGEARSEALIHRVEMISLHVILDDPEFKNQRQTMDESKLMELAESMSHEGLKVPITLVEIPGDMPYYHVRAGFRRLVAARRLGWRRIPAIVRPNDMPTADEYWINIIENSARTDLSTYELACAARVMRDKFQVKPKEFAAKTGYSLSHIENLLRCLDNLPDEILFQWKNKACIPLDMYVKWASLYPLEAVHAMKRYAHVHPEVAAGWKTLHAPDAASSPPKRIKNSRLKMASRTGLKRMMHARTSITMTKKLTDKERQIALAVLDFCSGDRDRILDVYDPKKMKRTARRTSDVDDPADMPELDGEAPPPREEDD
jgi:ParB/RepB/Spo0J family partition protein